MVEEEFPRASFGKPEGAGAYQVIEQHRAYQEPDVARTFRRLCQSFEWRPLPPDHRHPMCYGLLRVDGSRLLVARFEDVGRDLAGRPHTLHIECLIVPTQRLDEAWQLMAPREHQRPPLPPNTDRLMVLGDAATYACAR